MRLISHIGLFIEGQIRISYKMLKISLIHVSSGLITELTMGHLISDQFKSPFYVINAYIYYHKCYIYYSYQAQNLD